MIATRPAINAWGANPATFSILPPAIACYAPQIVKNAYLQPCALSANRAHSLYTIKAKSHVKVHALQDPTLPVAQH